jgi:hypothetical protein
LDNCFVALVENVEVAFGSIFNISIVAKKFVRLLKPKKKLNVVLYAVVNTQRISKHGCLVITRPSSKNYKRMIQGEEYATKKREDICT